MALTATLKKMLNALAHADAGEFMSSREKENLLGANTTQISEAQTIAEIAVETTASSSNSRRVALYTGSELPAEVMDYVIETCTRMQHDLTVLTLESEQTAKSVLQPHIASLKAAGINMKLATLGSGAPVPQLSRYLRGHSEVAFLACKDTGYLGRSYLTGTARKDALPVPVVVVATGKDAQNVQPIQTEEQKASNA